MITYDAEPCGSRYQDLAGRRFGRLVALERTCKRVSDGCFCWLCRCDCGNLTVTSSNKLLQGRTMSCGCYQKERLQSSRSYIAGTCVEIIRIAELVEEFPTDKATVFLKAGITNPQGFMELDENAL